MENDKLYQALRSSPIPREQDTHTLEILSKIRKALDGEFAVHSTHYVNNGVTGIIADLRYGNTYKIVIEVRHENGRG